MPLCERLLDGLEIDLGLARTCDAVDEDNISCTFGLSCCDGIKGFLLPFCQMLGPLGRGRGERRLIKLSELTLLEDADNTF